MINELDDLEAENPAEILQTIEEVQSGRSDPHMNTPKPFVSPSPSEALHRTESGEKSSATIGGLPSEADQRTSSDDNEASKLSEVKSRKVVDVALNVTTEETVEENGEENGTCTQVLRME